MKKLGYVFSAGILILLAAAFVLLGSDFSAFFRWYTVLMLLGIGFYPLTMLLFNSYSDCGWMFSKTIGIALGGYVVWLLSDVGVLQFTERRSIVVTMIVAGICWIFLMLKQGKNTPDINIILAEEFVFLAVFLMWTWFAGFRPEASGTEKFMDYGFMAAMGRNYVTPAKDIWYGLEEINYYYGGQFYGVYLAKLSYVPIAQAYNLYRMTIAAFAFSLPASIVSHMLRDRLRAQKRSTLYAVLGGGIAGAAVSMAGNMHYVLYGLFGKLLKLPGYEDYWFPSSTRYIGYNPDVADKCIHEFPSYSFILGDVHAHMVNVMFVLTVIGILYAWVYQVKESEKILAMEEKMRIERERIKPSKFNPLQRVLNNVEFVKRNLQEPHFILVSFLIGIFHWTNYWDFVIYFTVAFITCVFVSFHRYQKNIRKVVWAVFLHTVLMAVVGIAAALPFTISFDSPVSGIGIAQNHTLPHQMLILWGLPMAVTILLIVLMLIEYHKNYSQAVFEERWGEGEEPGRFLGFFRMVKQPDRFALILGFCAIGLILIPELVYVRDIYEDGYARSNTMFKLTYQAYIMFGLVFGYAFVRIFSLTKKIWVRILNGILLGLFVLTLGYFPYSVNAWFGNVLDASGNQGLDATAFIESSYPEDAAAIRWLDENVKGQPIVLEVYGDSYSHHNRVSAMTGIPTLEGWYVHEWLWRSDPEDLTQKRADIDAIYTSEDMENVDWLIRSYKISYIFVGSCEREVYPELNDARMKSLGEVVFEENGTYIVKVGPDENDLMREAD